MATKAKWQKKWALLLALMLVMALALSACGDDEPSGGGGNIDTPDVSDVVDEPDGEGGITLEDLDGWWYRTDEPDGISILDIFYLDGYSGLWVAYDQAGFEVEDHNGEAWMEEGVFYLDVTLIGEVIAFEIFDVYTLYEPETGATFERGEAPGASAGGGDEPDTVDYSTWAGRWFLNGVAENEDEYEYFQFNEDGTYERHSVLWDNDNVVEQGEFRWSIVDIHAHGENRQTLVLELDDGFMGSDLYPTDNLAGLLWEDTFENKYYIKEEALATLEGDEATEWLALLGYWREDVDEPPLRTLELYRDGYFSLRITLEYNAEPAETLEGTWQQTPDGVQLAMDDGSTEDIVWDGSGLRLVGMDVTLYRY
ncbi:MAG: hypothetical protein AB7V55_03075 [Oscillospiraceae bacterium]